MRRKRKLPPGLYRRKSKRKDGKVIELPMIWCSYYKNGLLEREPTGTLDDVEAALAYRHARLAETGQVRAQRRRVASVKVQDLLDLAVRYYGNEDQTVPPGMYETLNYALGHLKTDAVQFPQLDDLRCEWRRGGIRYHKDKDGKITERPKYRVRPVSKSTCNRYLAFLSCGYTRALPELGIPWPATLTIPYYSEPKNPRPIPPDLLEAVFAAMASSYRRPSQDLVQRAMADARAFFDAHPSAAFEHTYDDGRVLVKHGARGRLSVSVWRPEPEAHQKFLRFLYVAGPRKGQVLDTQADQYTPATGTLRWTDEDTKTGLPTSSPIRAKRGRFSTGSSRTVIQRAASSSRSTASRSRRITSTARGPARIVISGCRSGGRTAATRFTICGTPTCRTRTKRASRPALSWPTRTMCRSRPCSTT